MLIGGVLVGIAWVINAFANSLDILYIGAAICGIGAGAIYATCVGNAVKWFPDRRGLAVGLTAAGFGAGAAITVIPIKMVIDAYGYAAAFLWFGIVQGIVCCSSCRSLRGPRRRCGSGIGTRAAIDAQLHPMEVTALTGLLAAVPHVRPGLVERPDGDRAACTDRQGLRPVQGAGILIGVTSR